MCPTYIHRLKHTYGKLVKHKIKFSTNISSYTVRNRHLRYRHVCLDTHTMSTDN